MNMVATFGVVWLMYFAISFPINKYVHKASNFDAATVACIAATTASIVTTLAINFLD